MALGPPKFPHKQTQFIPPDNDPIPSGLAHPELLKEWQELHNRVPKSELPQLLGPQRPRVLKEKSDVPPDIWLNYLEAYMPRSRKIMKRSDWLTRNSNRSHARRWLSTAAMTQMLKESRELFELRNLQREKSRVKLRKWRAKQRQKRDSEDSF